MIAATAKPMEEEIGWYGESRDMNGEPSGHRILNVTVKGIMIVQTHQENSFHRLGLGIFIDMVPSFCNTL